MERVAVGRSRIHGKGVFARVRIRPGTHIGTFEGTHSRRDGPYVLWVHTEDGSERGIRGRNALRFLNHARRPNAEFCGADLYALRNIQPGAEVVIHYGAAWEDLA